MENENNLDQENLLGKRYAKLSTEQLAKAAVDVATRQLIASTEFKKARLERLGRYWKLYNGNVQRKLRQLFNIPIPVFPGMIDTLNAQYDTPINLKFQESNASDYFKVRKIEAAFQSEKMNTRTNSKWESKLRLLRKNAIMEGRGIISLRTESDPEYKTSLDVIQLKDFHFQPKGGVFLENHLFAGEEGVEKTIDEIKENASKGVYDKKQVLKLLSMSGDQEYLPTDDQIKNKLDRFKPFDLDPDNNNYVGVQVYQLAQWIVTLDGVRYLLIWHPWTKTWLRFEKWTDINSRGTYPWKSYATHEDAENFLSKSYGDDLYTSADAIIALYNQEMTNREKRNFGARAYDSSMFKDVRKLDEAMHRPDALVPADTKNGTRRLSEGVYEFKTTELNGTINLIDWTTDSLGRNTGANDLSMGSVQEVSKKASVTFAEQKSVSKRISWSSASFQDLMGELGQEYIGGLRDHMPTEMAIRIMGETGMDWDIITRDDLNLKKDIDIFVESSDKQEQENELKKEKRLQSLQAVGNDPILAPTVNPKKRSEELLRVGGFEDEEIAEFMDVKTHMDKKSTAKASESIVKILEGEKAELWFGANAAFMQHIMDYIIDKKGSFKKDQEKQLFDYLLAHKDIAMANAQRKANEDIALEQQTAQQTGVSPTEESATTPVESDTQIQQASEKEGVPGGVKRAMNVGESI